mmetsp:Transcript_25100/g.28927  ORF Transcript_25100/g.28927 Transcript_25100/m.28927 type:complete len:563 (+) Transcript_25100:56-1744(+)|eukprot:CAMPEP_0194437052 /NCGR_PEP_ID=MMETSP0176-20130528/97934_1 /TAXON_ID=216777 /ORGANISM="Proboscia alata, Strain PI-D3" /LENGTH=562 /DNA_ID=CAMNT_0039257971 /DNA_START=48 /DNA_END=1739 /DNA_ORIENTATION=-
MFPSIEPNEVGNTGLLWLSITYGYVLFYASNLISEGSDLLMLIPSLAGLVGGTVLPLLGAVPDGAIMLFSGLGDIDDAQESLSVGVGALAGSTIMLLTIPWFLSVYSGRVSIISKNGGKTLNYHGKPKLTPKLTDGTGVQATSTIKHGATIMILTIVPFLLIQIPASVIGRSDEAELAAKERWFAFVAFFICITGFVLYLYVQVKISHTGEDTDKRTAIMKRLILSGEISISAALSDTVSIEAQRMDNENKQKNQNYYSSMEEYFEQENPSNFRIPSAVKDLLHEILRELFSKYDLDHSNDLDRVETSTLLMDLNEHVSNDELEKTFKRYDSDNDGVINYDEFVSALYGIMMSRYHRKNINNLENSLVDSEGRPINNDEVVDEQSEEEDMPDDFAHLSPDEQKKAILRRSIFLLGVGTTMVLVFSDPMVDVMKEVAVRTNIPSFYVSFILAPLASNASEVIASIYYASKKTRKTITVSLSALEGAASMNNTFCLAILMGLIYFRGLAWEYTSETIAIVVVQIIVGSMVLRSDIITTFQASIILLLFPLSIMFIAIMKALGFD